MAYGEGLSTGAIGSLTRLMARPTRAERLQIADNNAAASRQASSQQHESATRERDYQQQSRERNLDRNAKASEVMGRQQEAEYMMERGAELAMERQRETNAFRLQSAMSKRKTSGVPGGTMRPEGENENSFARISGAGGEEMNYTPAGGTTYQPPGLYLPDGPNQIRPPRPIASSANWDVDGEVARAVAASQADPSDLVALRAAEKAIRRQAALPENRRHLEGTLLKELRVLEFKAASEFLIPGSAAHQAYLAQKDQLEFQIEELRKHDVFDANPGLKREVTSASEIPVDVINDAHAYAEEQGYEPRTPEYDEALQFSIRHAGYGK